MIQKITIKEFLDLASSSLVLDVRSPGEYEHAHIPGAYSLPLFTDEERKVVGTAYKQQSREKAIKIGLDYFGVKMRKMVEEVEALLLERKALTEQKGKTYNSQLSTNTVLVHCWRGGMRSAGVAWLLDLYGFKVYTLVGGYKVYRKWVREQFEKAHDLTVIGGYTGSAKTDLIRNLKKEGMAVIDLEAMACHKGSAFGAMGEKPQPSQEMFENLLAKALQENTVANSFIEDESQRIGLLQIPNPFWATMRKSRLFFLDIPFEARLDYLTESYGKFEKEKLVNAIIRIQKRLGGLETKTAINYLLEDNVKESFRILLKYYDKCYSKSLQNREDLKEVLYTIKGAAIDVNQTTEIVKAASLKNQPV